MSLSSHMYLNARILMLAHSGLWRRTGGLESHTALQLLPHPCPGWTQTGVSSPWEQPTTHRMGARTWESDPLGFIRVNSKVSTALRNCNELQVPACV